MIPVQIIYDLDIVANDDSQDRRLLYESVCSGLNLSVMDLQTVRDLAAYSRAEQPETDTLPLEAALIATFAAVNRGDLCLAPDSDALEECLAGMEAEAKAHFKELLSRFDPGSYGSLVRVLNIDDLRDDGPANCEALRRRLRETHKPLAAVCSSGVCQHLYFRKHIDSACVIKRCMCSSSAGRAADADTEAMIRQVVNRSHVNLDESQVAGLRLALSSRLTVISGGPGTGKTSIVFALLRCLLRKGQDPGRIVLAAPTGRAAQRMTESLRSSLEALKTAESGDGVKLSEDCDDAIGILNGCTIHRLLHYSRSRGGFTHNEFNPVSADVIIVDEVSMVDAELMAALLNATPSETRMILLGDAEQLPSVSAGGLLAELSNVNDRRKSPPVVGWLTKNHRSRKHILELANEVTTDGAQVNLTTLLPEHESGGNGRVLNVHWPPAVMDASSTQAGADGLCARIDFLGQRDRWEGLIGSWVRHCYLDRGPDGSYVDKVRALCSEINFDLLGDCREMLDEIFRMAGSCRILTLVREGPQGCERTNAHIARVCSKEFDRRGKGQLFAGAPVMITANDHSRELYNGDTGVILRNKAGVYRAMFKRPDGYEDFAPDTLPPYELAFAITVHKSQGSEYGCVFLVFPEESSGQSLSLQTREIVYTGITRARDSVVVYASEAALLDACKRTTNRNNGISLWHRDKVCEGCTVQRFAAT